MLGNMLDSGDVTDCPVVHSRWDSRPEADPQYPGVHRRDQLPECGGGCGQVFTAAVSYRSCSITTDWFGVLALPLFYHVNECTVYVM